MTPPRTTRRTFPLTAACPGQRVRVLEINGGDNLRTRLYAMGLTPGTPAEVIAVGNGPVILNVMGTRLMVGHGMAAKLTVREVTAHPDTVSGYVKQTITGNTGRGLEPEHAKRQ